MTKKIFWKNPYLTELDTVVKKVNGNQITVNETIFYAFSGGQESDSGTIGGYTVLNAQKNGKELYYTLDDQHQLKAGDKVRIIVDWSRRYQLMRLHFAAEIILELAYKKFPTILKTGAHIAEAKARIDFKWENSISSSLKELQAHAQSIIDSSQPIISAFSDEVTERRYWKIKEFSPVPCGGTHPQNTKEVGTITLKRINLGKGKERLEIFIKEKEKQNEI